MDRAAIAAYVCIAVACLIIVLRKPPRFPVGPRQLPYPPCEYAPCRRCGIIKYIGEMCSCVTRREREAYYRELYGLDIYPPWKQVRESPYAEIEKQVWRYESAKDDVERRLRYYSNPEGVVADVAEFTDHDWAALRVFLMERRRQNQP